MFRWSAKLYMDECVSKNPRKYRKWVEEKTLTRHCYVLTLPRNERNCLELYSTREFWFQYYHEREIKIVGMAASKDSAEELLCQIMNDVYKEYGDVCAGRVHLFFEKERWGRFTRRGGVG